MCCRNVWEFYVVSTKMIEYSGIANAPWVSQPVQLRSYFEQYFEKLPPPVKELKTCHEGNYEKSTMCPVMGTEYSLENFNELITYCAEDKLTVEGEPPSLSYRTLSSRNRLFNRGKIPKKCNLATLHNARIGQDTEYIQCLKYSRSIIFDQDRSAEQNLMVKKDIVITIRVHDTVLPTESISLPTKPFSQEICVLGNQSLCQLRDKIFCPIDHTTSYKDRENQLGGSLMKAKDVFKSGFIFIEDVFYNDFRSAENIDYSDVIVKWAKSKNIGDLAQASMSETKFEDLTVRFGFPYVYQHQGNCEHLIVFSDASLLQESEEYASKYPLYKSVGRRATQQCMICHHFAARWITFENEQVPVDPYYFCDKCFKMYNFIDGKKIGNFKYYEYHPFIPIQLPK